LGVTSATAFPPVPTNLAVGGEEYSPPCVMTTDEMNPDPSSVHSAVAEFPPLPGEKTTETGPLYGLVCSATWIESTKYRISQDSDTSSTTSPGFETDATGGAEYPDPAFTRNADVNP
jgi:hypothetical protein